MNRELMAKYEEIYAMYIEYPHKSVWKDDFGDADYRTAIGDLFSAEEPAPSLLYVHIPFCPRQCFYCTCHTVITRNYERIKKYLESLYVEIDLIRGAIQEHLVQPNFCEIHLGGGSPTILQEQEFDRLLEKLQSIADIKSLSEFAIEIDPRETTKERLMYYHSKGMNRISLGVQDFDPDVQKAVNRVQPRELVEELLTPDIRERFHGINFDIMWGLPRQTRESFKRTIKTVIELSPDRVSLLLLHYAPDIKKHQRMMKKAELPDVYERTEMFHDAVETLHENGYVRIGLEHFAKPGDGLSIALRKKKIHWNSLGYTAGRYLDIIGLGPHSSSTITSRYYFQNYYELSEYEKVVSSNRFPVYRGYKLDDDDIIRRDVIHSLRSYFTVEFAEIEKTHGIVFNEYFEDTKTKLEEMAEDEIVELSDSGVTITEEGKDFTFHVCRVFDNHIK